MKRSLLLHTAIVACAVFALTYNNATAAEDSSKPKGTIGSATGGAGGGKINAQKTDLNPQPLPPGSRNPEMRKSGGDPQGSKKFNAATPK